MRKQFAVTNAFSKWNYFKNNVSNMCNEADIILWRAFTIKMKNFPPFLQRNCCNVSLEVAQIVITPNITTLIIEFKSCRMCALKDIFKYIITIKICSLKQQAVILDIIPK